MRKHLKVGAADSTLSTALRVSLCSVVRRPSSQLSYSPPHPVYRQRPDAATPVLLFLADLRSKARTLAHFQELEPGGARLAGDLLKAPQPRALDEAVVDERTGDRLSKHEPTGHRTLRRCIVRCVDERGAHHPSTIDWLQLFTE